MYAGDDRVQGALDGDDYFGGAELAVANRSSGRNDQTTRLDLQRRLGVHACSSITHHLKAAAKRLLRARGSRQTGSRPATQLVRGGVTGFGRDDPGKPPSIINAYLRQAKFWCFPGMTPLPPIVPTVQYHARQTRLNIHSTVSTQHGHNHRGRIASF